MTEDFLRACYGCYWFPPETTPEEFEIMENVFCF